MKHMIERLEERRMFSAGVAGMTPPVQETVMVTSPTYPVSGLVAATRYEDPAIHFKPRPSPRVLQAVTPAGSVVVASGTAVV